MSRQRSAEEIAAEVILDYDLGCDRGPRPYLQELIGKALKSYAAQEAKPLVEALESLEDDSRIAYKAITKFKERNR